MDLEQQRRNLMAAAREATPADQAPYAFEHRVMAHLRDTRMMGPTDYWAAGLWRAVLPSLVLLALTGMAHWQSPRLVEYFADSASNPDELEAVFSTALDPSESW